MTRLQLTIALKLMIALTWWLLPAATAATAATAASAPPEVGIYAVDTGPHRIVAISPRPMGEREVLILTSLGTGAVRALTPSGEGTWTAGETLVGFEPAALRLEFSGYGEGGAGHLTIHELASGASWAARRIPLGREEVSLGRDGTALQGTLHVPPTAGPHPAVVLAPGSEDDGTRHSLDALPYVLAADGFLVLAVDKRGTGASEGTWDVDHPTLAADLAAWVEWLATRATSDGRIGIFGFSEGAWIAPLAAASTPHVDFIVASGGGALPKSASFLHQARRRLEGEDLSPEERKRRLAEKESFVAESLGRSRSGTEAKPFDLRMARDSAPEWSRFRGPILFVIGEDDVLVPPRASAQRLGEILTRSAHPDFTLRVFPDATHGMFRSLTGSADEFFRMEGIREHVPGYWETLLRWLDTRVPRR